jgi:hypothetical protein
MYVIYIFNMCLVWYCLAIRYSKRQLGVILKIKKKDPTFKHRTVTNYGRMSKFRHLNFSVEITSTRCRV